MPAVVVRQSKPWRRADGVYLYFEDNAGVVSCSEDCSVVPKSKAWLEVICGGANHWNLLWQRKRFPQTYTNSGNLDRQSQGRNEGLSNHWPGRKGGCGAVAC